MTIIKSLLVKHARFRATTTLSKLRSCFKDKAGLKASYRVAYGNAKENQIRLVNDLSNRVLWIWLTCVWRKQKRKSEKVSLSNDTVRCRISDMSQDI